MMKLGKNVPWEDPYKNYVNRSDLLIKQVIRPLMDMDNEIFKYFFYETVWSRAFILGM